MLNSTNAQNDIPQRPANKKCELCGNVTVPFFRRAVFDLPAKWLQAPDVCSMCKRKIEEKAEENKQKKAMTELMEKAFNIANIAPRFRDKTFGNYSIEPDNKHAHLAAFQFNPYKGDTLVLMGKCGVGKTHLAAAIANTWLKKVDVLFVCVPEMLHSLRENFSKNKTDNVGIQILKTVKLLVLDDIGAEKSSDWVREIIFLIINYRYEHKLSTVITTNHTMQELDEKLGIRIVSRIMEMSRQIKIDAEDWRLKRGDR